jgi:hypothetical protein
MKNYKYKINVMDEYKTVQELQLGKSIARYGDGEFQLVFNGFFDYIKRIIKLDRMQIFGNGGIYLSYRLRAILKSDINNLLIGVPNVFYQDSDKKWKSRFFIENRDKMVSYLDDRKLYSSSFYTRYNRLDTHFDDPDSLFEMVKDIWSNKKVAVVNFNHNILDTTMFDNVKNPIFIKCARRNAWGYGIKYIKLLRSCLNTDSEIVVVIAGPVATLLAHDLAKKGKQCIDIGQMFNLSERSKGNNYSDFY